ncbi:tyrosine-protein phosphatase [Streptomyces longispororuber]|uniref:tyrosine-protein phosphatase n=1 Tax=Streptomyces longispororuber TaxID=68230 RepID=UPI0021090A66|nr:tyrosine-protein phosphatase [Streptomyces longispororuber]MCQ4207118.1 tyrosine-protein phosphatase [Streptomyces longispororuber]
MAVPIPATTVANLRDLGGTPLADGGRVRPGLVFRSGQLDRLDPAADPAFAALGIRTILDLRTDAERAARPDRTPDGVRALAADALADKLAQAGVAPAAAQLKEVLADPVRAERQLGGGKAEALFADTYRSLVSSGSARAAYRTLLLELAAPDAGPLLFHCTAGKDRTGWGTTVILTLLGADDATVEAEYLAVNAAVRRSFAPLVEGFTAQGGDPDIALSVIGVVPGYLGAALEEVATRYGGVETYVREGLGVPDEAVAVIRKRLTADG